MMSSFPVVLASKTLLKPSVILRYPEALADKTFDNTGCG